MHAGNDRHIMATIDDTRSAATSRDAASAETATGSSSGNDVAGRVDDAVDGHPWLERLTAVGWIAKGIVYTLMGLTAVQIARQSPTTDDASPEGALGRISDAPFGRVLLGILTIGLLLYSVWRVLSVALIRGRGTSAWADRVGYGFSALFYLALAWTAGRAAVRGHRPGRSSSVERYSRSALEMSGGRVALGLAGLVTMAVGAYFIAKKGIARSFTDDLDGVVTNPSDNEPERGAIVVLGVAGWIGRGVVTILVGFFVTRAAWRFDPNEARGFDQSLRQVAETSTGSMLVLACAVGLIAYGVFCLASYRLRSLEVES